MAMTDPIADLLTRIRNGSSVGHEKGVGTRVEFEAPHCKPPS